MVSDRNRQIIERRRSGESFGTIGTALEISRERVREIVEREQRRELFSSTYCLRFDAGRLRRGAEHDRRGRRDLDRRIPADGGHTASGRGGRL